MSRAAHKYLVANPQITWKRCVGKSIAAWTQYRVYAYGGAVMSDEFDWDFSNPDDAKAEIRAAVGYLLNGAAGSDRGDIVREIIAIVNEVARGLLPGSQDPLDDDDMPGG